MIMLSNNGKMKLQFDGLFLVVLRKFEGRTTGRLREAEFDEIFDVGFVGN